MAEDIRYCTTEDGVRIAYQASGSGPALLLTPDPFGGSLSLRYDVPPWREFHEKLSEGYRRIEFDVRGCGHSQRDVGDVSFEAIALDIAAVVDAAGVPDVSIWATGFHHAALRFAARHPERVRSLVLYSAWINGREDLPVDDIESIIALARANWPLALQAICGAMGNFDTDQARNTARWVSVIQASITPARCIALLDAELQSDISDCLARVTQPVLVMHRRDDQLRKFSGGQRLAAMLPSGRLVSLEGATVDPSYGDSGPIIERARAFLDETSGELSLRSAERAEIPSAFRTVLFTDLEGHTQMMAQLGDQKGREVLREHERITRDCLKQHGGTEVKTMGDGFMASFGSARKALECATALQRAVTQSSALGPQSSSGLRVRCGINAGEPIAEGDDLFGASVIVAARIAAKATGAQILVADVVRQLVAGKGFLFSDTGEHTLRGFEEPVRIWELRWRD